MNSPIPVLLRYSGSTRSSLSELGPDSLPAWKLEQDSDQVRLTLQEGHCENCALGLMMDLEDWSRSDHVHVPSALYAGNRFEARPQAYSPRHAEADARADCPTLITDVSRLDIDAPRSAVRLKEGDSAFPCIAIFRPEEQEGILFAIRPGEHPEGALHIEEDLEAGRCRLMLSAPGVREDTRYSHCDTSTPSEDRGISLSAGESITFSYHLERFPCASVSDLMTQLFRLRHELFYRGTPKARLPFSEAFSRIERHYNRDFWGEEAQLYFTSEPGFKIPWQAGWCGGLISTWPLMQLGSAESRERSIRNVHKVATEGVSPSGLIRGKCSVTGEFSNDFRYDETRPYTWGWSLVRRGADLLYYGARQYAAMEESGEDVDALRDMLLGLGDVFCRVWKENGQIGQFLDTDRAEIVVGNSSSGALLPAALVTAAARLQRPDWHQPAAEIARYYIREFLNKGYTTGGPGDAMQNPDSESCAALLESLVELYEQTKEIEWLQAAERCARLCATWVMPYDYRFPADSEFGRLEIQSTGSVYANTQNKHSAPGICTHAGLGLLKLYRFTGDERYLRLIESIARCLPQCVSLEERPIYAKRNGQALPDGWINERLNTSDWDFNVGGVFYGPCWCEVSMLLTVLELPGVYLDLKHQRVACMDHVDASWHEHESRLEIHNPTAYEARVQLCVDENPGANELPGFEWVEIPAGEQISLSLASL